MIRRIKTHNILNGIAFSTIEFIFIAAIVSPFAIYYIVHSQAAYALVSVGIVLNCLTVAGFGIFQWHNKEQGVGWQQLLSKQGLQNKQERERINRENPHLMKDTLIITAATLIPYIML